MDVFDLLLFSVVRVASLQDLGLSGADLTHAGATILSWQMAGILAGAFFWGVAGDRLGRKWVILGSITIYSIATLANAWVTTVEGYCALRCIAGFGLAGELGAAIVLVAEILPREVRGYGTTGIAAVGGLGAIAAALVGAWLPWRLAYGVGGIAGLVLLGFRRSLVESHLFESVSRKSGNSILRGNLLQLFWPPRRALRYLACVGLGLPVWFAFGILFTFSPEIAASIGIREPVSAGTAILFNYIGFTLGDLSSGLISQRLKSRRKVIGLFLSLALALMVSLSLQRGASTAVYYGFCGVIGFSLGYWVLFATLTGESFGTNLRSTAGTSVPQVLRAAVIPMVWCFSTFKPTFGVLPVVAAIGAVCFLLAGLSLLFLRETFGVNLDYLEKS